MTHRHQDITARERGHLEAVRVQRLLLPERRAVGRDANGTEGQAQHVDTGRRGIERGIGDTALCVDDRADDRRTAHEVILATGPQHLRQPGQGLEDVLQRHRVGDLEPGPGDNLAAVDVVLHHAGLQRIIGGQQHLATAQFARPLAARQDPIPGVDGGQLQRPIPQRATAAAGRLGVGPGTRVHVAARLERDAGTVQEEGQQVPRIGAPLGEDIGVVQELLDDPLGHVLRLHRVLPVPVVPPPGIVDGPQRQELIAQIDASGLACRDQTATGAAVTKPDQRVEEGQHEGDAAGLQVALGLHAPGHVLRVGIPPPRRLARLATAPFGQELGPMQGRFEPAPVPGELVGPHQFATGLGHDVELDEPVGIGRAVVLALGRATDQDAWPRVVGGRLAVVDQEVGKHPEHRDRRRIAGVAVIVDQAGQNVGGTLRQVTIVPVRNVAGDADRAVRGDAPIAVEHEVRSGGDRRLRPHPGIALQRLDRDPYALVALTVLPAIPGSDDPKTVLDPGMGVVACRHLRTRRHGRSQQRQNHGHRLSHLDPLAASAGPRLGNPARRGEPAGNTPDLEGKHRGGFTDPARRRLTRRRARRWRQRFVPLASGTALALHPGIPELESHGGACTYCQAGAAFVIASRSAGRAPSGPEPLRRSGDTSASSVSLR